MGALLTSTNAVDGMKTVFGGFFFFFFHFSVGGLVCLFVKRPCDFGQWT